MSEEQSRAELIRIHQEYMKYPPEERMRRYDEYKQDRERVRIALSRSKSEVKNDPILEEELTLESFKTK